MIETGLAGLLAFISEILPIIIVFAFFKKAGKISKTTQKRQYKGINPDDPFANPMYMKKTDPSELTIHKYEEFRAPDAAKYVLDGANTENYSGRIAPGPASGLAETFMKDDRQHDWLAKQKREEERIARKSGLDLGALHDQSCDARNIKMEHEREHGMF